MPDLPTITVTQAQANRMMAAFGTTAAYREWLRESIVGYVIRHEVKALRESNRAAEAALSEAIVGALPTPPTP